jgi:hypothetical protein
MSDKDLLIRAQGLLREWIYELAPLDDVDLPVSRDYQRLCAEKVHCPLISYHMEEL